jgi:hypothetical protein
MMTDNPVLMGVAVSQATHRYINEDKAKAARVVVVADKALAVMEDDIKVPVELLIAAVRSEIQWNTLSTADKALVDSILLVATNMIQVQIDDNMIDAEEMIGVRATVKLVRDAAMLYAS